MADSANGETEAKAEPIGLASLAKRLDGPSDTPAPVHLWDPPYCGDIGMEIRRDGTWFYQGTPIGRPALVKVFARILRKDEDGCHYLVTPVEKVLIHVEAAPFIAVSVRRTDTQNGPALTFTTNLGQETTADADHPIRVETDADGAPVPFVRVRAQLDALITRSCFFDLVALAQEEPRADGPPHWVVKSAGAVFPIGPGVDPAADDADGADAGAAGDGE